jgi:succinate dehydrogenase flavin-adding protein (antitoxin of CptAB toxin-antitoxin module)
MDEDRKARINRLKWHCRRALLELDLVFDRFWERYEDSLDEQGEAVLARLAGTGRPRPVGLGQRSGSHR